MSGRSTPLAGYGDYRMDSGKGKMGWIAAFGTGGYPDGKLSKEIGTVLTGEPPLLEELGVNFGHIKTKVFLTNKRLTDVDLDCS